MAVQSGSEISRVDIMTTFNLNVVDFAYSGNPWCSTNIPKYNSVETGQPTDMIPATQFDTNVKTYLTTLPTGEATASTIVAAVVNITNTLTRIRNLKYFYYHSVDTVDQLQSSGENKGILKEVTPVINGTRVWNGAGAPSSYFPSYYTKTPNITNMTQPVTVSPGSVVQGQVASASGLIAFFNTLKSAWSTAYANTITYNYYTCHSQCHSNCYYRARR